jgi:hypothetical protein
MNPNLNKVNIIKMIIPIVMPAADCNLDNINVFRSENPPIDEIRLMAT